MQKELRLSLHDSLKHPITIYDKRVAVDALSVKIISNTSQGENKELQVSAHEILIKVLNDSEYGARPQNKYGRTIATDEFIDFCLKISEFENLILYLELYKSIESSHVLYGTSYISSELFKSGDGQLDVLIHQVSSNNPIGYISVDYLIVSPWKHPSDASLDLTSKVYWNTKHFCKTGEGSLEMGHRGCGSSFHTNKSPADVTENTIASFQKAYNNGADYVELDVQLSKDLIPIVYHDYFTTLQVQKKNSDVCRDVITGVKDLTLIQMNELEISIGEKESTTGNVKIKKSGVGDDDKESLFPTLAQVLQVMPINLGIFIEVKFPMQEKDGTWEIDNFYDRNTLVDNVLNVVSEHGGKRKIMFCCFDPSVCIMLSLKQTRYPVVFTSNIENDTYVEKYLDLRMRTFQMAKAFAISESLLGVSLLVNPILDNIEESVKDLKAAGLQLFTWGGKNVNLISIRKQKQIGVTGIIYDRIYELKEDKSNKFDVEDRTN